MARRRRIAELLESSSHGTPGAPGSIFGPETDNAIPGEVIFALEADAAADLTGSIPSLPHRSAAGDAVTSLGASALDDVLGGLQVESITRVHGPSPSPVVNGIAMADDLGLDGTLRIRYGSRDDPADVAGRLADLAEVAWAEPNRYRESSVVPNDPRFASQWGLTAIKCPDAWDITTGSPSVVVAV